MSNELLSIGSTPYGEPCLQVGRCSSIAQKAECRVFEGQIRRYYPVPEGATLRIVRNDHDFGAYYEVNCYFNPDNKTHCQWAYAVKGDALGQLEVWDEEALKHIKDYVAVNTLPQNYFDEVA